MDKLVYIIWTITLVSKTQEVRTNTFFRNSLQSLYLATKHSKAHDMSSIRAHAV